MSSPSPGAFRPEVSSPWPHRRREPPAPTASPGPEPLGPPRPDVRPRFLPAGEPPPAEHPPPRALQAQQHDPQPDNDNGRRGGLVKLHQTLTRRGARGRARRIYPQPDRLACGHRRPDRDLPGPCLPSGAVHRAGTQETSQTAGAGAAFRTTAGTARQDRATGCSAAATRLTQPTAALASTGAPITNTATRRTARQAAILSVRRRSGLPSRPSLRATRDAIKPSVLRPVCSLTQPRCAAR